MSPYAFPSQASETWHPAKANRLGQPQPKPVFVESLKLVPGLSNAQASMLLLGRQNELETCKGSPSPGTPYPLAAPSPPRTPCPSKAPRNSQAQPPSSSSEARPSGGFERPNLQESVFEFERGNAPQPPEFSVGSVLGEILDHSPFPFVFLYGPVPRHDLLTASSLEGPLGVDPGWGPSGILPTI
jgi:hypothetical protein